MALSDRTQWAYRKLGLHDTPTMALLTAIRLTPFRLLDQFDRHEGVVRTPLRYLPPSAARRRFVERASVLNDAQRSMFASLGDHGKWQGLSLDLVVFCVFEGLDDPSLVAEFPSVYTNSTRLSRGTLGLDANAVALVHTLLSGNSIETLRDQVRRRLTEPFRALGPNGETGLEIDADGIRVFSVADTIPPESIPAFIALGGEPALIHARDRILWIADLMVKADSFGSNHHMVVADALAALTPISVTTAKAAVDVMLELEVIEQRARRLRDACATGRIDPRYRQFLD